MDRAARLTILARAVHETIRAFGAAMDEPEIPVWDASGWMQESSREAVEFALGNPTPGAQHEAWCESKRRAGFRYGPAKDERQKTHPSLVPFDELPESERRKDAIIIAIVTGLAPVLGIKARSSSP